MRKVILALLLIFSLQLSAQGVTKFMGIPITGTADEFGSRLIKEKGFKKVEDSFFGKLDGRDACRSQRQGVGR